MADGHHHDERRGGGRKGPAGRRPSRVAAISRREWIAVVIWAVVVAVVMLLPTIRKSTESRGDWRFTGIISDDFRDTAYHLSWVRQARDGFLLFENKYAGADSQGPRFFNLLFLVMGWTARVTGLGVIGAYHVFRTLAAILVLVLVYWFSARFFADRRMRWVTLALVTFSAGFHRADVAVGYWPPYLENLDLRQTVTFWSLEWEVVVGPAMALLVVSMTFMWQGLMRAGWGRFVGLMVLGTLHASIYPHDVPTVLLVGAALAVVMTVTAGCRRRAGAMLGRGIAVVAAFTAGALPVMIYHAWVLMHDIGYSEYAAIQDKFRSTSWPNYYGLIFFAAVIGAAAIVRRRERHRALLVTWPAVVGLVLLTPYPVTQRVHLFHGIHIVLCALATRGLWAVGGLAARLRPTWSPAGRRHAAVAALAVLLAASAVVTVGHYVGFLRATEPGALRWFTFIRRQEREAVQALDDLAKPTDVIACLPAWGVALPMWTGSRVYVGHLEVTVDYLSRKGQMEQLMGRNGRLDPASVAALLRNTGADFLFVDTSARAMGSLNTEDILLTHGFGERVFANDRVTIYRIDRGVVNAYPGAAASRAVEGAS